LALSMGQYNVAQRRLEKALAASPSDQTTMQLLGEVYAIQGNVKQSAFLLASTPSELQERLHMRTWWYEYIDAPQEAAWLNTAIEQR
ncbi:MAG: tetratricopeptide repeat protein, partial [Caldilineaceae bacterium]|nr:tetratricopeptide repeat protein [Caldilineaceae bacterium]